MNNSLYTIPVLPLNHFAYKILTPKKRLIVFDAQRNLEILCYSSMWGTFKTASNVFAQIFTIIGLQERADKTEEVVAVPLVYTFSQVRRLSSTKMRSNDST